MDEDDVLPRWAYTQSEWNEIVIGRMVKRKEKESKEKHVKCLKKLVIEIRSVGLEERTEEDTSRGMVDQSQQ